MESCPFRQLWLDSVHTLRLFVSNTSTNTTHCTLSHNPKWSIQCSLFVFDSGASFIREGKELWPCRSLPGSFWLLFLIY